METPYEVLLSAPALARDRLSATEHISAEVKFAEALETACAATGGIVTTYRASLVMLEAWRKNAERTQLAEPDTWWKMALRKSEREVWTTLRQPQGAVFEVRVVLPPAVGPTPAVVPEAPPVTSAA